MKHVIASFAALASLFSQTIALGKNGVYAIVSPRSGDVWGVQNSIGVKHRVELVHPEDKHAEHWRLVASGPDFFIQNVYTQGMLSCPKEHPCEVDTLGNNAQLFKVLQNADGTFIFHPSETPLVVGAGEDNELAAQPSDPSLDAVFLLRPVEHEWLVRFRLQDGKMGILTGKHFHNTVHNTHYIKLYRYKVSDYTGPLDRLKYEVSAGFIREQQLLN